MKLVSSITTFFICFSIFGINAQADNDNIIIESKSEIYTYKQQSEQIILEEKSTTDYLATKWPETIIIAEFYNLFSKIEKADAKAAGKRIVPVYRMYESNGIFYSDSKVCYMELPFSKKNEKISVSFKKIYEDVQIASKIFLFEPQFIKEKKVEVIIPSWIKVDIVEKNFGNNVEKRTISDTKSGIISHIYIIKNQDEIRNVRNSPEYHNSAPYLLLIPRKATLKNKEFSYFNSYIDVYKWCKEKIDHTANNINTVSEFTQQLISSCSTDEEKIARIFSWVQNNIRYIAFEYGFAGWVPDNAQNVLSKKYGDCKGMANLLKVMLQSAGYDGRMAWILTKGVNIDTNIPLPIFNHSICALFEGDKITYLDATAKYMAVGEYHRGIEGCATLIENGENYIIHRVPKVLPPQNKDSLSCTYTIEGNLLVGNVNMVLTGENKQYILSSIYALNSARRNSVLKRFLENGKSQLRASDIIMLDSIPNRLELKYNEISNGSLNQVDNELYIDLDIRQDHSYDVIDTLKRKQDFLFLFKEQVVREENLVIPPEFEVMSIPENLYIEKDNYIFSIKYDIENDKVKYRKEIIIKDTWLKKENFNDWNNDLALLKKKYSEQIILHKIRND